jgi:uncharacterized protein YkwD
VTQRGNYDNPGKKFGNEVTGAASTNSLQLEAGNLLSSRNPAPGSLPVPGEVSFDSPFVATKSDDPFASTLAKIIENIRKRKPESTHKDRDDSHNDRIKPKPDADKSPLNLNDSVKDKLSKLHLSEEGARKMNKMAEDALTVLNDFREKHGRKPLKILPALQVAAALHAAYQADTRQVSHKEGSRDFADPVDRMAQVGLRNGWAENAGAGQFQSGEDLAQMWIHSKLHRAALLRPELEYVGLGLERQINPKTGKRSGDFMGATLDMWAPDRRNT